MADAALLVAGIIFSVGALVHLLRLCIRFEVRIGGWNVPFWFSAVGFPVALGLAVWMFAARC